MLPNWRFWWSCSSFLSWCCFISSVLVGFGHLNLEWLQLHSHARGGAELNRNIDEDINEIWRENNTNRQTTKKHGNKMWDQRFVCAADSISSIGMFIFYCVYFEWDCLFDPMISHNLLPIQMSAKEFSNVAMRIARITYQVFNRFFCSQWYHQGRSIVHLRNNAVTDWLCTLVCWYLAEWMRMKFERAIGISELLTNDTAASSLRLRLPPAGGRSRSLITTITLSSPMLVTLIRDSRILREQRARHERNGSNNQTNRERSQQWTMTFTNRINSILPGIIVRSGTKNAQRRLRQLRHRLTG
jgi:hypothetical protein